MNRPSRGDRLSVATTRYVGCFFLPMRIRRSFTATDSFSCRSPHVRKAGHALGALAALPEHLHHLLDFLELLQQLIPLRGARPTAGRDPEPPRSVDHRRLPPFLRGHRPDDRFDPGELPVVDLRLA